MRPKRHNMGKGDLPRQMLAQQSHTESPTHTPARKITMSTTQKIRQYRVYTTTRRNLNLLGNVDTIFWRDVFSLLDELQDKVRDGTPGKRDVFNGTANDVPIHLFQHESRSAITYQKELKTHTQRQEMQQQADTDALLSMRTCPGKVYGEQKINTHTERERQALFHTTGMICVTPSPESMTVPVSGKCSPSFIPCSHDAHNASTACQGEPGRAGDGDAKAEKHPTHERARRREHVGRGTPPAQTQQEEGSDTPALQCEGP